MKKLITILMLLIITQPIKVQANDDWELMTAPLALTGGALVCCAFYIHKQARTITALRQDVATKQTLIDQLTTERDAQTKKVSVWNMIINQFKDFIPFLCIKEASMPPAYHEMWDKLGFQKSLKEHKVTGLVTLISRSPTLSKEEKNLVSDEEDSLEAREQTLNQIGTDLSNLDALLTSGIYK